MSRQLGIAAAFRRPPLCYASILTDYTSSITRNMYLYLHGFNSGGTSSKARRLRTLLAPVPVLSPTYPVHQARAAVDFLREYIAAALRDQASDAPLVLIGSSLGGFYAQYLAPEFDTRIVLINPSLRPDITLLRSIGPNHNEATGEDYTLSADEVHALGEYRVPACDPRIPALLLLDTGDELLDYRVAEAAYRECGKTIVYAGGNHRFEHLNEAAMEIRRLHDA